MMQIHQVIENSMCWDLAVVIRQGIDLPTKRLANMSLLVAKKRLHFRGNLEFRKLGKQVSIAFRIVRVRGS